MRAGSSPWTRPASARCRASRSTSGSATAPGGLRRVGRLGDGWLASFITPDEARAGRRAIQAAAAEAGREVDPEHFGISLPVTAGDIPAGLAAAIQQRRPGINPASLVATGWPDARRMIEQYVGAGLAVRHPAAAASSAPATATRPQAASPTTWPAS